MAKQFLANRSGQTPTLDEVPNETIKIYSTEAAADADLANLEENEIFATDEDNNPASGTQYPVDVVQDGNMNAVTSNAVAGAIGNFYPSGSYSFTDEGAKFILSAYISSSSTSLVLILPITHESGKTINITNIGMAVRTGIGGYVEGTGATRINMTDYNFTFTDKGRLGVLVSVVKKDGSEWYNSTTSTSVVNNTACTAAINEIEFTVS